MIYVVYALYIACLLGIPALFVWAHLRTRRKLAAVKEAPEQPRVRVRGPIHKPFVVEFIRNRLGPDATYKEYSNGYAVVEHPEYMRMVFPVDHYSPRDGRERVIQRMLDTELVDSMRRKA